MIKYSCNNDYFSKYIFQHFNTTTKLMSVFHLDKKKPTCARVAAITTVAHNKNKQYSFDAKVNFTLLLPYA
jgi:hypothetical protein